MYVCRCVCVYIYIYIYIIIYVIIISIIIVIMMTTSASYCSKLRRARGCWRDSSSSRPRCSRPPRHFIIISIISSIRSIIISSSRSNVTNSICIMIIISSSNNIHVYIYTYIYIYIYIYIQLLLHVAASGRRAICMTYIR